MNTFYSEDELRDLGLKKYGKDVKISRNAIIYQPSEVEVGDHVRIDDFATISGKVIMGDYIHIAQFCSFFGGDAGITIGDYSSFSSKVSIYTVSSDYSGEFMAGPTLPPQYINSPSIAVNIGKNVIIGCGSVVLRGVTIGEGCAVGAMSLCTKSLEPWGIYGGIPVKRLKERSKRMLELTAQLEKENAEK